MCDPRVNPYLVDLGTVAVPGVGEIRLCLPAYGTLLMTALLVGRWWFLRSIRRAGLDEHRARRIVVASLVAALLGAKVQPLLTEIPALTRDPGSLASLDHLLTGGSVWAGVVTGIAVMAWLSRRYGLGALRVLDLAAVPLPVCQALGRLGCLLAGCCYGAPCEVPWGITYRSATAHALTGVPLGVRVHPSPVYDALWSLGIVLPGVILARRLGGRAGITTAVYVSLYSLGRLLLETVRGDPGRGAWIGILSTSQVISIGGLASAAVLVVVIRSSLVSPANR